MHKVEMMCVHKKSRALFNGKIWTSGSKHGVINDA